MAELFDTFEELVATRAGYGRRPTPAKATPPIPVDLLRARAQLEYELTRIYEDVDLFAERSRHQEKLAAALPPHLAGEYRLVTQALYRCAETLRQLAREIWNADPRVP